MLVLLLKLKLLAKKPSRIAWAYLFIFPFLLFVLLERLNPASSAGLFAGGVPHVGSMLVSVLFIVFAIVGFYALSGSVFGACESTAGTLLVVYTVNYFKVMVTGGVFVPSDLLLARAAFDVAEPSVLSITFRYVSTAIVVLLLPLPLYIVKLKMRFLRRIWLLPLVIIIFIAGFTGPAAMHIVLPVLNLNEGTVTDRYRDNGMLLGFYTEVVSRRFDAGAFNPAVLTVPEDSPFLLPPREGLPMQPNVIVVMSESFVDPTVWGNINFSQYPVPNLRRLAEGNISGNVLVPVFGGGTVNTEMEFLTGGPHVFYGSRFYVPAENMRRYFTREMYTALPWLFRQNGYHTVGVHTFYEGFFSRNEIYPLLGFNEFIAKEQMPNAVHWGEFISDEYFTDQIISQILQAEENEQPLFLFGISMQNHWEFEPMKYGTLDLAVMADSPYLSELETQRVNSFLQGIYDADKQLGRLIDFIEERDTPTIVVFFGDHLPILGRHQDRVFENLGFVTHQEDYRWTLEDRLNMFSTPYLVWANYCLGFDYIGNVSTFLLGAIVAEAANITLNRYFTYVLQASHHFRGITNEVYLAIDGTVHQGWENRNNPHVRALEALWYANVFETSDFQKSLANLVK